MRVAAVEGGALAEPLVADTPEDGAAGVALLGEMVERAAGGEPVEALGGGIAGIITDGKVVDSPNLRGWEGVDLEIALKGRYPTARVAVANDAAVACLGEARFGAGKGYKTVGYITVGTGIGGARVVNGTLDPTAPNFEPGRQIIDAAQGTTLESVAGGAAVGQHYGKQISELTGAELAEVVEALGAGVVNALELWAPDVLVVGGGATAASEALVPALAAKVGELLGGAPAAPVVRGALGEHSGLWGGIALLGQDA